MDNLYRKKPVVVEAFNVRSMADVLPGGHLHDWLVAGKCSYRVNHSRLAIGFLGEWMGVEVGDWIIKGVKGRFYPCKPEIFALTYEHCEESDESQGIVSLLRSTVAVPHGVDLWTTTALKAADEIEHLRHEVKRLKALLESDEDHAEPIIGWHELAMSALDSTDLPS